MTFTQTDILFVLLLPPLGGIFMAYLIDLWSEK
jgi:hypothetical protein